MILSLGVPSGFGNGDTRLCSGRINHRAFTILSSGLGSRSFRLLDNDYVYWNLPGHRSAFALAPRLRVKHCPPDSKLGRLAYRLGYNVDVVWRSPATCGTVGTRSRAIRGSTSNDRVGCSASDRRWFPARPA